MSTLAEVTVDERRPVETLYRLCRRPRVVLDVGAGQGFYALLFRAFFDEAALACFEPENENFRTLAQNGASLLWDSYQIALAERNGDARLHVTKLRECCSLLLPMSHRQPIGDGEYYAPHGTQAVRCQRLDDWIVQHDVTFERVDILKMDVQGGELGVLRGAPQLLERGPIILTELMTERRYVGQPLRGDIHDYLVERGYRMEREFPGVGDYWSDAVYVKQ